MHDHRAVCTAHPGEPGHRRFATIAQVVEEWEVTERGDFVSVLESLGTAHGPDRDNVWTCLDAGCGAPARFEPKEG